MNRMKTSKQAIIHFGLCLALCSGIVRAGDGDLSERPAVRQFIDDMVARHEFSNAELTGLFNKAQLQQKIIEAISKPAESKPWHQYRPIFITQKRINAGVEYWRENMEILSRAQASYGIPPQIITAILRVETFYGKQTGGYRMLDSLATLAFDYPPRSRFFMSELEHYLLMAREEQIDPLSILGSYAGAMGKAQFISTSYRRYAIDFHGDGKRDLWNNNADNIGSIAYYLSRHGWQAGQPIVTKVTIADNFDASTVGAGLEPNSSVGDLRKNGVHIDNTIADDLQGVLISLENMPEPEYWVGFENFYAITRYNHSALYAMAVYQLGEEILAESAHFQSAPQPDAKPATEPTALSDTLAGAGQ